VLGACRIDTESHYKRIIVEFLAVQQDYAQIQIIQPTFQKLLELPGTGGLELTGNAALVDTISIAQLIKNAGIISHANPPQDTL